MNTSPERDLDPPYEKELTSAYWRKKFNIPETHHLSLPLMRQLRDCKTDDARRLILDARMVGQPWKSRSAQRER